MSIWFAFFAALLRNTGRTHSQAFRPSVETSRTVAEAKKSTWRLLTYYIVLKWSGSWTIVTTVDVRFNTSSCK